MSPEDLSAVPPRALLDKYVAELFSARWFAGRGKTEFSKTARENAEMIAAEIVGRCVR